MSEQEQSLLNIEQNVEPLKPSSENEVDDPNSRKSSSTESGVASDDLRNILEHDPFEKNSKHFDCLEDAEYCYSPTSLSECRSDVTYDSDEENFCMDYDGLRRCDTITEEDDVESEKNCTEFDVGPGPSSDDKTGEREKKLCSEDSSAVNQECGLVLSTDLAKQTSSMAKKIESCLVNLEESLELNRIGLTYIPETLFQLKHLQNLYLNNNQLSSLPETFFPSLPALSWLDLRYNLLECLPWNICEYCNLTTLLLEGNRLTVLPPELGLLPKLRGLNIRNNPLVDPPEKTLSLGLQGILQYLRRKVSVFNEDENDNFEVLTSRSIIKTNKKSKTTKRNENLNKPRGLIPYELGAEFHGIPNDVLAARADEDEERLKVRLSQDQINAVLQHMKSEVALKTWRHKARLEQMEAVANCESECVNNAALNAPYATDENFLVMMSRIQLQNKDYGQTSRHFQPPMPGFLDSIRRKKERDLERQIRQQLEKLQETAEKGSVDLEEATVQLAEVERLQKELTALFRTVL